jgi:hypothetical protein
MPGFEPRTIQEIASSPLYQVVPLTSLNQLAFTMLLSSCFLICYLRQQKHDDRENLCKMRH